MEQRSYPEETAHVLLEQFELILDHHKLIDEVGFVHPCQFAELNEDSSVSRSPTDNIWQILDEASKSDTTGLKCVQNEERAFWYGNHKLAISIQVVPLLYNAARLAHMDARRSYKISINMPKKTSSLSTAAYEAQFPETDLLKHSMVLLILSPDFGSVWNSRRWVIKKIAEKFHGLYDIIGKESEFVERIAEKSKMNYRAWNHRCWLIIYMTKGQMFNELDKSRKWAELHVADNCCFHYRRRLMLKLLEDNSLKDDKELPLVYKCRPFDLLKEELKWNMHLIKQYMGREALWVHRRILSYYWIKSVTNPIDFGFPSEVQKEMIPHLDCFLGEEMELIHTCLNIPVDEFEDTRAQAQHAAAYMLWISKKIILSQEYKFQEKLKEVGDLKTILINTSPDKSMIWERLLEDLPDES